MLPTAARTLALRAVCERGRNRAHLGCWRKGCVLQTAFGTPWHRTHGSHRPFETWHFDECMCRCETLRNGPGPPASGDTLNLWGYSATLYTLTSDLAPSRGHRVRQQVENFWCTLVLHHGLQL